MQLTFLENDKEDVILKQDILSILIDGISFSVIDVVVNVHTRRNDIAITIIEDFLKSFDNKIFHVKALSEASIHNGYIDCPQYRINKIDIKPFNENSLGSFKETMQREIVNGLYALLLSKGLDYSNLGVSVVIKNNDTLENQFPNENLFRFIADFGDGLKAHHAFLSWTHNKFYQDSCPSCQAGVSNMFHGINYLDNRVILPNFETKGNAKVFKLPSGSELTMFDNHSLQYIVTVKDLTPQKFAEWFAQMFLGAIEMGHINNIRLRINGEVIDVKGTEE